MACLLYRIIQFTQPQQYSCISLKNGEYNIDFTYSWSYDGSCWTEWCGVEDWNKIMKRRTGDFYLRLKFCGRLSDVFINGDKTTEYTIQADNENIFLKNFCEEQNLFQPYNNLDCAIQLQQQLSDTAICIYGIPIYYFKVEPQENSVDYVFKEYKLHDISDVKMMKVMVEGNELPSSKPEFTEWNYSWESGFIVEVSKSHFARAFGDSAIPGQRDVVYIPLMKKLWTVNSSYDEREGKLMYRSTTWKLVLNKYNESSSVDAGEFQGMIDGFMGNKYSDVIGDLEEMQTDIQTGMDQISNPKAAANNLYPIYQGDAVRGEISKDLKISNFQLNNTSSIVAKNFYEFPTDNTIIKYQKTFCSDSGTLMFLINFVGADGLFLDFGQIKIYKTLKGLRIKDLDIDLNAGWNQVVIKWDYKTMIINAIVYPHILKSPGLSILAPHNFKFDFENPAIKLTTDFDPNMVCNGSKKIELSAYPSQITNIKLYTKYLSTEEHIKESIKFITKHESLVFSDIARPMFDGFGFSVK